MSELTPLAVAALGLLAELPKHPYQMYQILVHRSEDRIVKVRPGSLYHTVDRLARQGYVEAVGTEREGNRPERTTYRITEAGRVAVAERIAEIIATPVNEYPEFPVGVAEAHNLSQDFFVDLLGRRKLRLQSELDILGGGYEHLQHKPVPKKYWLDITYQQAMINAEIAWIDGVLADLDSGDLDWSAEIPTHLREKEILNVTD